jgi:hypothetical protein
VVAAVTCCGDLERKELFLQNLSGGTELALAIFEKKIKTEKR